MGEGRRPPNRKIILSWYYMNLDQGRIIDASNHGYAGTGCI